MVGNASTERVSVLGCPVDALDMPQTVERCLALVERGTPAQHVVVNAAKLVEFERNDRDGADHPRLRDRQRRRPGRRLGRAAARPPLPERVAGIDLMHELMAAAAERGLGVFLLGARPRCSPRPSSALERDHPGLRSPAPTTAGSATPRHPTSSPQIREARPDMLFVAMSSPRRSTG